MAARMGITIPKQEPLGEAEDRRRAEAAKATKALAPGPLNLPAPAPPNVSMEDAMMKDPRRQGLSRMIQEMNIQQRVSGATGGQSVALNGTTINVHGVAPGREALMAKKTALALRDPVREGLAQLRRMQREDNRTGYV